MTILPDFYRHWVIDRPWPIIVLLALSIGYFGWNAKNSALMPLPIRYCWRMIKI